MTSKDELHQLIDQLDEDAAREALARLTNLRLRRALREAPIDDGPVTDEDLVELDFDRGRKVPAYRRGGVPEVWVVNLPERQVEVTDELGLRVYQPSRDLAVAVGGVEVDLDALFADLESDLVPPGESPRWLDQEQPAP